ncbi:MAG: RHS repeat-associated core domain-containing protein [Bacteroidaceae bacterium]|nr:RHS repeat-associated core domain-containing protein [Bacteroidaceae bacterium]
MKKLIFILLCSVGILNVDAQNIIRPKIAGPNGLFVNSYNGVLFFGQTDIETQNTAMPMQLRFYYNSSAKDTNYGYGLGFSLGYEMRYEIDSLNNVVIETGDGRTDTFTRFGEEFQSPAGVFSTLTYKEGIYTLTEKTGETYEFSDANHKRLTAQTDRNGNRTTLTYSADSLLTQIQDAVGHTITLEYSNKLLSRASATFLNGSITYTYDAKKRLTKRTDAMGYITVYDYDRENHLDEIVNANGNKILISYNASGMVSRMKTPVSDKSIRYDGDKTVFIDYTDPQNQYSYYRWDDKGRVIEKVGLCCGIQSKLEYDEDDNVIKRIDANGNATTYTYDDRGNMLSLTDAEGNTERYTYEENFNQVTSFTDKNGNSYRFSYDSKGSLTSITGPLGFSNSFTYNDKGWPLTTTDANGNVTLTTYNNDGTTERVMDAAGYYTSYTYDECGNITSLTDGRNNTTTYAYDKNNQITSQTDALGNTTTVSYDKVGNIVRVKNTKNQIRAYTYDALGNVLTQTDPQGGVYTYTYDGKGNVLSVTDPIGNTLTFTWSEKNKLLTQTNAEGETTTYDYDAKGNLTSVFQPNGNVLQYFYDRLDRVEQLRDNMGLIAKYTYDGNGNQLTVTDGLDRTMTYTYDVLNRRTTESLPSGATTKYEYDGNSNLLTVTDAKGNATTYTYSSLNQQLTHTDALNAKTQFEYDANGNLTKAIDAKNNATTYAYDGLNQNTTITFANGLSLQYTYDELGRIIASKDRAGREFKYAYNPLGNLLTKTYPDGSTDKYTYDGISRMLSAVNKDATVNFTYDRAGRLLSETLNGKVTGYSYDVAAGKRTLTYPSGMKVEEHLNARDLITSILQNGEEVVTMDYNAAGQKTSQGYANGITTTYGYNENGWLSSIVADHDIMSLEMDYDAIGNITERRDLLDASRTESYGYDLISQLTSFKRGTTVDKSYQFDLLGNRIKVLENGIATNYTSNNVNAYTNITGGLSFTPQYDDNGNMLNDDKHTYAYDFNNKLVSIDQTLGTYKYDALGRRIAKNNTLYYYVANQIIEEYVDNKIKVSYLYGNEMDEAIQMKKDGNDYYYHINHLCSPMVVSNDGGIIVENIEYDAYGLPSFFDKNGDIITNSSIENTILFTGQRYDTEYNGFDLRSRNESPSLGRFVQKDIFLYINGLNDYSYTKNNPTNYVDPYGHAYFASRPLKDTPWLGPGSMNLLDDITNTEISHEHIFFEDDKGGNIGFGPEGRFSESDPQGYRRRDNKYYDDALLRKALENVNDGKYKLIWNPFQKGKKNNCQDWAERVRKEYERLEREKKKENSCEQAQNTIPL